mmetsp:Transcript_12702/g.21392  ORF Transcript_12702/g.21392 Transcript_12702/m.21392 type:complete len:163 (+) Transcript_12702:969-1457(+)
MIYGEYLEHLTKHCPKIELECPFLCEANGKVRTFEKFELKSHLTDFECPNFHVYCVECGDKVLVKDRVDHYCVIKRLYNMMKKQVASLQVCEQMCRECHNVIPGHTVHTGKSFQLALTYSKSCCSGCSKFKLKALFDKWREDLTGYHRDIYKGSLISPWHHY